LKKNGWKGRVQDTNRKLEINENNTEKKTEGEKNTIRETGMPVKKWKD
jgi:hypothetical protein